jgi:TetR/AcrR family transcriptional repressor of nem operon
MVDYMTTVMYSVKPRPGTQGIAMKVSRAQAAANRERILDAASALFRERGLDGIGVAEVMQHAGLTHGGFYGHFASKEDLITEACGRAFESSVRKWASVCADNEDAALSAIAKSYLSIRHRDHPGDGCAVAALGTELSRHGSPLRGRVTEGVRALVDVLARVVPGRTAAARRKRALAAYASMIGGLVLARAVDDPKLSRDVLRAVSASIGDVG